MGMVTVEIDGKRYTGKLVSEDNGGAINKDAHSEDFSVGDIVIYNRELYRIDVKGYNVFSLSPCSKFTYFYADKVRRDELSPVQDGSQIMMANDIGTCMSEDWFEVVGYGMANGFLWVDINDKKMVTLSTDREDHGWYVLPSPDSTYWRFTVFGLTCVAVANYDPEQSPSYMGHGPIRVMRWPVKHCNNDELLNDINWVKGRDDIPSKMMDYIDRTMKGVINIAPCGWFGE